MSDRHRLSLGPIATPDRLLLGPGPSNAHPTVLQALVDTGQFNPYTGSQSASVLSQFRDMARQAVVTRLTDASFKLDGPRIDV